MFIVPKPQKTVLFDGAYEAEALAVSGEDLEKMSGSAAFFGIQMTEAEPGRENLFFSTDPSLGKEEYEICIDKGGIRIVAAGDTGFFRAFSTLKQILAQKENGKIPYLKIHDYPDIEVRGLMLCQNSSCIYTMETLYYIADCLARMKFNMLQLYFDTFVFEYDSFAEHLDGKVYYTKEEIRNFDAYCKERHIELMANVETFGHLGELLRCDEYKHLAITRDGGKPAFSINPLLEESFETVKRMLDDLLPHFSSTAVNIGMDETYGIGEGETEEYCRAFGTASLYLSFLKKVSGYVRDKHHKRSMIWGDMAAKHPECIGLIPKDVIYVDWGYEPGHKFDRNAIACREAGLDYYVAPGTHNWFTVTGRTDIMVQNVYFAAESARHYGAKGFLLTDWSSSCAPSLGMLAYCTGAAFSWNSGYSATIAEGDNEMDCAFRHGVILDVLRYCDRFIYGCTENSLAELIYRMGNYWVLEQPSSVATWNGTLLGKLFFGKDTDSYPPLSEPQLRRIGNYISEIRDELAQCTLIGENGERIRTEVSAACDTVLFAVELAKNGLRGGTAADIAFDAEPLLETLAYLGSVHLKTVQDGRWAALIKEWTKMNG